MDEKIKRCADCRNGEHENYDNNIKLVYIRDGNRICKRAYLCQEHRNMYFMDGYSVTYC